MTQSVLIVEDDYLLAEDHKQTVEELGWKVVGPAATIGAALHEIEAEHPTLGLLDLHVAGQLVTPVVIALRNLCVPFIVVSGEISLQAAGGDAFAGAHHVMKPYSTEQITNALKEALAGSKSEGVQ